MSFSVDSEIETWRAALHCFVEAGRAALDELEQDGNPGRHFQLPIRLLQALGTLDVAILAASLTIAHSRSRCGRSCAGGRGGAATGCR
jgi:hypothetical protein